MKKNVKMFNVFDVVVLLNPSNNNKYTQLNLSILETWSGRCSCTSLLIVIADFSQASQISYISIM